MPDFFFRTEDLKPDEVLEYFVETQQDRQIVEALKNRNPTILVGSRGVGKSFLLRVAQQEMLASVDEHGVFPVYLSFVRSSLLQSADPEQFKHWMLARICSAVVRALVKAGKVALTDRGVSLLTGGGTQDSPLSDIEKIADQFEDSWKSPGKEINSALLPSVDALKQTLEDLAEDLSFSRFALLIDEAAHVFLPEQQRQFFTLFRDLRSHAVTCNAAVYPGVTAFGDTFQPVHDATMLSLDRDILASSYLENMREIVEKQAEASILKSIAQNSENFGTLAYAASGNPRILLKTVAAAPRMNSTEVNGIIRDYYRTDIWSEHSVLAEKYAGHREVIDWGRRFIEAAVIPDIAAKNEIYLQSDKSTSAYLWLHRDAPAAVKEALRILAYTGIVNEQASGIKASRAEIGTRYMVNLGCLFAQQSQPSSTAFRVATNLTPKRMTEFGANHPAYKPLLDRIDKLSQGPAQLSLATQMEKPIDVLDLSPWQKDKLLELDLGTVGKVFGATEAKLKEALYVGDKRARRMRNAAVASVLEYLSG